MRFYGKGRHRQRPGEANKLEAKYGDYLASLYRADEILWWGFQCWKFRLADKTWYCPDWCVMLNDLSLEAHEIKGTTGKKSGKPKAFWEDDARVKIKVAADIFPVRLRAVHLVDGQWVYEEF